MLILLPPSEGKAAATRGKPLDLDTLSHPSLTTARGELLDELTDLCARHPQKASEILGLGKTQAAELAKNAALRKRPAGRADAVYTGVLYEALDLPSLTGKARTRSSRWIGVQSALFGLVSPNDRIPSYRLSADTTLPGVGKVAPYWRDRIASAMNEAAGKGLVIDLRSAAYASFWRPSVDVAQRTVSLRILQEVDGRRTIVSHANKASKGRITRALLEDGSIPGSPKRLAELLRDLKWKVEEAGRDERGIRLDVIVKQL